MITTGLIEIPLLYIKMKHNIDLLITEIAHRVSKMPFLKHLISPFYSVYLSLKRKKASKLFNRFGIEALSRFDKCLNDAGVPYTLAFGTLLGAIREQGFIRHDLDIDVFMFIEDFSSELISELREYGLYLTHEFLVDGGKLGREQTYTYKGVSIDVFFVYPPIDKYPYCCDFLYRGDASTFRESMSRYNSVLARRLEIPISRSRRRVPFEDKEFYVPANAEQILEYRYGSSYLTPNPNWSIRSFDTHIIEWPDVEAKYFHYC